MAESTGSKQTLIDEFWDIKPNDRLTSDNNSGGRSVWCDKDNIWSLEGKVRVGDILEFVSSNLPGAHWGIYIDELDFLPWNVVHFIPGNKEGRTYSDMKTCLNVSFPPSHHALVVNTIYTLVSMPGGKVRINNLKDTDCSPLCTEYICKEISYQLKELHKRSVFKQVNVYMCRVSFKDSENFVNFCRYDRGSQHCRCLLNCEKVTEWYSKANIKNLIREVRVGDRLEFRRNSPHNHWCIYIGKWGEDLEQVVYFIPSHENKETRSAMTSTGFGSSARDKPELCVESIGPVLRDDEVRINNERDRTFPPLVRKDILDEIKCHLLVKMHRYACKVSFSNAKDFVNYCRYDDLRINFGLVSDWCESGQSLPRLHVGDRLEFHRTALPCTHWGIYVGKCGDDHDQVVHFSLANGNGKRFSKKKSSGSGSSSKEKQVLCIDSIQEVSRNDKVRINNERDHIWTPFDKTHILDEIERQLKSQSHGDTPVYDLFQNDCEHFVNHCRYGSHHSVQVSRFSRTRDPIMEDREARPATQTHQGSTNYVFSAVHNFVESFFNEIPYFRYPSDQLHEESVLGSFVRSKLTKKNEGTQGKWPQGKGPQREGEPVEVSQGGATAGGATGRKATEVGSTGGGATGRGVTGVGATGDRATGRGATAEAAKGIITTGGRASWKWFWKAFQSK